MKRIDYIVKNAKGVLKDDYSFREKKIKRALESSIDYVEEHALDSERKAIEVLNSIKDVANDSEAIKKRLNEYITQKEDVEGYKRSAKYLKEIQKLLDEEVEVEDIEKK